MLLNLNDTSIPMDYDYEGTESLSQQLTFEQAKLIINQKARRDIALLDIRTAAGTYNNYALLISDQCPWHIILDSPMEYIEFSGPLPIQMMDCIERIRTLNPTVDVSYRVGKFKRFPSIAIKEAIVNSIIHFDPSTMKDIHIVMDHNMICIRSPGSMSNNRAYSESSTSARNNRLAHLMMHMGYASLKGKGTTSMKLCYDGTGSIPRIKNTDEEFQVFIPSIDSKSISPSKRESDVHAYILRRPGCQISELSAETMISVYELKKILDKLEMEGLIFSLGVGSKKMHFLTNPSEHSLRVAS